MITLLQVQTLASLTPKDIIKVYSGRPSAGGNHCRCGCRGNYRYSSHATLPEYLDKTDVNDRQVAKTLALLQANIDKAEAADDNSWFDVEIDGRSYTAYVNEAAL